MTNVPEYSVSEISGLIKRNIEDIFSYVRIRGEISGLKAASSGHIYFSLKDEQAVISAICWRGSVSSMDIKLSDGLEVICTGKVTSYPGQSKYQIIVENASLAGVGALMQLLEKRKKLFAEQGLFNDEHKKELPKFPRVIGVITSPTGAVIKDILHRIRERFPLHILLWPVAVQGDKAAEQVATAIAGFNELPLTIARPDVIIVARGGGSIEDLWAFNEEIVVRNAFHSKIPIISAIGHETDYSLLDLVADKRAPTPTGAAEIATPLRSEIEKYLSILDERMKQALRHHFQHYKRFLKNITLISPLQIIHNWQHRFDLQVEKMSNLLNRSLSEARQSLALLDNKLRIDPIRKELSSYHDILSTLNHNLEYYCLQLIKYKNDHLLNYYSLLNSYHYPHVLSRGFSVTRQEKEIISSVKQIEAGKIYEIEFNDGHWKMKAL